MPRLYSDASVYSDAPQTQRLRDGLLARLPSLRDISSQDPRPLGQDEAGVMLLLTGGTEADALRWIADAPRSPLCLVAHPDNNSLAAALELKARLLQGGRYARLFLMRPEDDEPTELAEWMQGALIWEQLRRLRVGMIGQPSPWLVASRPDYHKATEEWGPQVEEIPLQELYAALDATDPADHEAQAAEIASRSCRIAEPTAEHVVQAVQVYEALQSLVERYGLDALSLRCFDLIEQRGTTGCLALALLSRHGIVAGCEGDLPSLLTLLWARTTTGHMGFMGNQQDIDPVSDTVWLAHCTMPISEGWPFTLRSHYESGKGVALEGDIPPGPVTLLRIGGWDMKSVQVFEGQVRRGERSTRRCRTQVRIRLDTAANDLLEDPLGNHLIMIPGRHRRILATYHRDFVLGR